MNYQIMINAFLLSTTLFTGSSAALEPIASREPTIWLGPQVMELHDSGIGKSVPDVSFSHLPFDVQVS